MDTINLYEAKTTNLSTFPEELTTHDPCETPPVLTSHRASSTTNAVPCTWFTYEVNHSMLNTHCNRQGHQLSDLKTLPTKEFLLPTGILGFPHQVNP